MRELISIISAVLLLASSFEAGASSCTYGAFNDCMMKAKQGDANAQTWVGIMYYDGKSVPQDDYKAFDWLTKAAEQCEVVAQYNLGVMYEDGRGAPQDYLMAHMFFNLAAANGNSQGAWKRSIIAEYMTSSELDEAWRLVWQWAEKHPSPSKEGPLLLSDVCMNPRPS
jgi:TPR repeat protein